MVIIQHLKKERHRQLALAQDLLIEELYRVFPQAVFHGGTAIWRCFQGGRFSEDLDVYINKDEEKIEQLFSNLKSKGLDVIKKKIGKNSLYGKVQFNRYIVSVEAIFKKVSSVLSEYEKADGNILMVYTLTVEQFIQEKIQAYLGRRKIRDLYDIFYLLRFVKDTQKITQLLADFLQNFSIPLDEKDLQTLILEGAIPNTKSMLEYIKRWVQKNT